jgi:hypothetical protein
MNIESHIYAITIALVLVTMYSACTSGSCYVSAPHASECTSDTHPHSLV